jgi:large repetitive protein
MLIPAVAAGSADRLRAATGPLGRGYRENCVRLGKGLLGLAAMVGLCGFVSTAMAQTAHFKQAVKLVGSGFVQPNGIAIDGNGDIFVADARNQSVKEILAVGGYTTTKTLGSGFLGPSGVAVDGSGNVFVTDVGDGSVKEILAAGGYTTVKTLSPSFAAPFGVAVDGSGNVFVTDEVLSSVKEILAVGGYTTIKTLGSGFLAPSGVAVDGSGNVFVTDASNSSVEEFLAAGGYTTVNTLGTSFVSPDGVTMDSSGNLFTVFDDTGLVTKTLAAGGYTTTDVVGISSFGFINGVAVDKSGDIFVVSEASSVLEEIMTRAVDFGSVAVDTSSPSTLTLTFTFDTNGTIGAPAVFTQGATGLDFTDAGTGTCTTNGSTHTYSAGDTCTVDVTFNPKFSGARHGAITLNDSSGNVIATAYIYGTGMGPQVTYTPSSLSTLGSGFSEPQGLAVDGNGDVFVADYGHQAVKEIMAAGGYNTVNTLAGGHSFTYPSSMAIDGSGNIFVADPNFAQSSIVEIMAAGGYTTVNSVGSGLYIPSAVAVDGRGNIFVGDTNGSGEVKEIPYLGGSYGTPVTLSKSFVYPTGLAVDESGNVFVADGNGVLSEIPYSNGTYGTPVTLNSSLGGDTFGLMFDRNGNLFITNPSLTGVPVQEIPAGGNYAAPITVATGFSYSIGLAVDGSGNLFVGDARTSQVVKLDYADPPTLSFGSQNDGSAGTAQSFQITNDGNMPLTAVAPGMSVAANFTQVAGSGTPADCTTSFSLSPNASCNVSLEFAPAAPADGTVSGSVIFTDNNLNASPSTMQTVPLTGTATDLPMVTDVSPSRGYFLGGNTVTITGTNFTWPLTVFFGSSSAISATLVSSNTIIATVPPVPIIGAVDVIVTTVQGASLASSADQYTYALPPMVSSILPSNGLPSGGNTVTIDGESFTGATSVTFGSTPASFTLLSDTEILATAPAGAAGTVSVIVTTPLGSSSSVFTSQYTYIAPPQISGFSPSSGSTAGGDTVTITGTGLSGAQSVLFDNGGMGAILSNSSTQIVITTPPHSAGPAIFTVNTIQGGTLQTVTASGYTFVASAIPLPFFAQVPYDSSPTTLTPTFLQGTPTSLTVVNNPRSGRVSISGLSFIYTPATGFNGSDSFTYTASNAVGTSGVAVASITVTPPTISVTPTTLAVGTEGAAYSQFLTANGGAIPYTFSSTLASGSLPPGLSLSSAGQISGTPTATGTYIFQVSGTDSSTPFAFFNSSNISLMIATGIPAAPTIGAATGGNGHATVSFTAPASNGGAAITGYTVTASPGNITATGTASPVTITGLANGTAYTFTVTATNSVGTSAPSGVSNPVTPSAPPITNIGTTSATQTVTLAFTQNATLNVTQSTAIQVLTQGAPNLDFNYVSGGTCTAGATYVNGDVCTVNFSFTPTHPGMRYGAAALADGSGTLVAMAYISGTGTGPQITFGPGQPITLPAGTGYFNPSGVAVDGNGNIFVADIHNNAVKEIPFSAGAYGTPILLPAGSGFNEPMGVAVDGSGDIFVADSNNGAIKEIPYAGGVYGAPITLVTGFNGPEGVAVDGSGNVFVADSNNSAVKEIPNAGGVYSTPISLPTGSGFSLPSSVAVDGGGNVFVADSDNNAVKEIPYSGGSYGTPISLPAGSGFSGANGVAVDGSGNVFVADINNNAVKEIPYAGGVYGTPFLLGSGFNQPAGVAVDGSGNIFVGDAGDNRVVKLDLADAPSLNFAGSQIDGTPSAPQFFQIMNNGNAPLIAIAPGMEISAGFTQVAGNGTPSDCNATFSLAPGTFCNVGVEFAPASGANSMVPGSITFSDNNLNVSPSAMQTVALSGAALALPPTVSGILPSSGSTAGGTTVTIFGVNLTGATGVLFGSAPASRFLVVDDNSITATAPGQAEGTVDVIVTTPGGTSATSVSDQYTFVAPVVASATSAMVAYDSTNNQIALNISGGAPTSVAVTSVAAHGNATASGTAITYTPTTSYYGADSFTYTATNPAGTSAPAIVSITVSAPIISVTPTTLLAGTFGVAYNQSLTASGGQVPYSFSTTLASGALPAGLSLSSAGTITGMPTVAGNFNFTVTVIDSSTPISASFTSSTISLTINATAPGAPTIDTATAGNGQATVSFTAPASNGGAAITGYTVTSSPGAFIKTGTASPLTVTGLTNGTTYTFTVAATNSVGTGALSSASNAVTPGQPIATQLIAFENVTQGAVSTFTPVHGTGGTGSLRYSVSPSLPPAFTIDPSSGVIAGTPTNTSTATLYSVTITDVNGTSVSQTFTLTVNPALVVTQVIPSISVAQNYATTPLIPVSGSGGTPSLSYRVSPTLPGNLSMNVSTGTITGTPVIASPMTVYTVKVVDATGVTLSAMFSLEVDAATSVIAPVTNVGSTSTTQTVTLAFAQDATLNSTLANAIQVLTQGAPDLDFNYVAGGTCTPATAYLSGDACTVDISFTPTHPGTRYGAATLTDASGAVVAVSYISGTGIGPQITFNPGAQSTLGNGFNGPNNVVVDGRGDIFVADFYNQAVKEIPYTAGSYGPPTSVGANFSGPVGVAVDGSGNIFVADSTGNAVKEILAASGYTAVKNLGSGFIKPRGVAVDGSGNVFVADYGNNAVKEILAVGGYTTVTTLGNGFNLTFGVAVDASGNAFVLDSSSQVKEITAASGYTTVTPINPLGSSFNGPLGVSVDGVGNIFIADTGNSAVKEISAASGYTTINTLSGNFSSPFGVTVDGSGNVFVADAGNNQVVKLDYADPPSLTFGSENDGSSSAVQSFQIANNGNAPLTAILPGLGISTNFSQVTGSGTPADCTAGFSLVPAMACNVGIAFTPTPVINGPVTGTAIFTDNSLNANPSVTQTIPLSGTAMYVPPVITGLNPSMGSTAGGNTITIMGANLAGATAVLFGGVPATNITSTSSQITTTAPADSAGLVDVIVIAAAGTNSATAADGYTFVTPVVASNGGANIIYDSTSNAITLNYVSGIPTSVAIDSVPKHGTAAASGINITYTPTTGYFGTDSFTYTATDGAGTSAPAAILLTISSPTISVTPVTLASGTVGTPYSQSLTASGGQIPYSFLTTLASGSLPAGLSLSSAGVISGTPTAAGNFTFTVTGTDSSTTTHAVFTSATLSLTIVPAPSTITSVNPAMGSVIGGTSVTISGSSFITGTTLTFGGIAAGNINIINATTLTAMTPSHAIGVVDIVVNNGYGSQTLSHGFTYTPILTANQKIASTALTQNYAATPFTPVAGSGGAGSLVYSVSPGLPTGLSMAASNGIVTGTPTVTITARTYTVTVTDSNNVTATAVFTLTVNPEVMSTQNIASKILTQNYATPSFLPVTGSGGTGTLAYSISPNLPAGLVFSTSVGGITGTPTAASTTATYTVTVTDANGAAAKANFSLTVNSTVIASQSVASIALTQNHVALPVIPITGTGGTQPLTYSISPNLAAGLNFDSGTGTITGTPNVTNTAVSYAVTVTDSNGATAAATFNLTVNGAVVANQTEASASLVVAQVATAFAPVKGTGGTGSLTYSVLPTLPPGLNMASETGTITGTPGVVSAGSNYAVTVADSNGAAATAIFSLAVVTEAPTITFTIPAHTYGDAPFSVSASSNSTGTFNYSVVSGPATISGSTVTLTGAGTIVLQASQAAAGNYSIGTQTTSFLVDKDAPTIMFSVGNHTYGDAPFVVTATSNSTGTFSYTVVSGPAAIAGATVTLTGVGPVVLLASEATDPNHTAGTQQAGFTVSQMTLSLTANNATRYYGAANSAFTGSITGAEYGDTFMEDFSANAGVLSDVGTYAIVPSALGANLADYVVAASNGTLSVTQAPTITSLKASGTSINPNQTVTLTATVASTTSGMPTQTVTFLDNGNILQTLPLTSGSALYTTALSGGITHLITANYAGDSNFLPSSTGASSIPVNVAPFDLTLTDTGANVLTVAPGKTATYTFTVSPNFGTFAAPVTFTVAGLPAGATATFSPSTIPINGAAQTVTMTIQTSAPIARNAKPDNPFGRGAAPVLFALFLLPFVGNQKLRRRMSSRALAIATSLICLAAIASLTGCSDDGFLMQQPQTYTLAVTVTSGTLQHTNTVTLIVQ